MAFKYNCLFPTYLVCLQPDYPIWLLLDVFFSELFTFLNLNTLAFSNIISVDLSISFYFCSVNGASWLCGSASSFIACTYFI